VKTIESLYDLGGLNLGGPRELANITLVDESLDHLLIGPGRPPATVERQRLLALCHTRRIASRSWGSTRKRAIRRRSLRGYADRQHSGRTRPRSCERRTGGGWTLGKAIRVRYVIGPPGLRGVGRNSSKRKFLDAGFLGTRIERGRGSRTSSRQTALEYRAPCGIEAGAIPGRCMEGVESPAY